MTILRTLRDGVWKARGWPDYDPQTTPPPPASDRDSLVYGTYQPSALTTGVLPGTTLVNYNSPSVDQFTLPSTGGVIENKRIHGDIFAPSNGAYWIIRNCEILGGSQDPPTRRAAASLYGARTGSASTSSALTTSGVNQVYADNTGRVRFIDCTITPRLPHLNRDCIVGHKYSLERCNLSRGIDGAGVVIGSDAGTHSNVEILGSWIHDLMYGNPDYKNGVDGVTWHTNGSHSDLIQCQGGGNIRIIGNWLNGTGAGYLPGSDPQPNYPYMMGVWNIGAGVLIQNNTGVPAFTTANTVVTDNWVDGTIFQFFVTGGNACTYKRNHHYRDTAHKQTGDVGDAYGGYWMRFPTLTGSTIDGVTTGDVTTNVWVDGPYAGDYLREPRDRGIHIG